MRVVLDTNVLVRATKNATGPARELLGLLRSDVQEYCAQFGIRVLRDTELLQELRQPSVDDPQTDD